MAERYGPSSPAISAHLFAYFPCCPRCAACLLSCVGQAIEMSTSVFGWSPSSRRALLNQDHIFFMRL